MERMVCEQVIVGGGLVGSLLALLLRQRGHQVHVFEKRPDMRKKGAEGGRSINLVVTSRGLAAVERVGLREAVLGITVPVYGRMMHDVEGQLTYQSYSKDDTACNYAVSRSALNWLLMDHAEAAGVRFSFEAPLEELDVEGGTLRCGGISIQAERIFATDGSGSAVRQLLAKAGLLQERVELLSHGYKELVIPTDKAGQPRLSMRALHIWPRGDHMLMALPNLDGSMTVTLYLANEGERSFAALREAAQVRDYFLRYYPDAVPLIPYLEKDFLENPTGILGTVYSLPWHVGGRLLLLGDAAHGIVPFFGQGMNLGFEDCSVLDDLMTEHGGDWEGIFAKMTALRKPNADAIAAMALENFTEMRDKVGDARFLLEKQVEALIAQRYPSLYCSRYSMVTHTLIPYHLAYEAGKIQQAILRELCASISSPQEVDWLQVDALLTARWRPFVEAHPVLQQREV